MSLKTSNLLAALEAAKLACKFAARFQFRTAADCCDDCRYFTHKALFRK